MTDLDAWLWLSLKDNLGNKRILRLLETFETPVQLFQMDSKILAARRDLTEEEIQTLSDKDLSYAKRVKALCRENGIRILTYDSDLYPNKLKQIPDPPCVLYIYSRERINLNDKLCIAMVGNRLMTEYGRCAAVDIAKGLAAAGVVVVSGMARGIDGAAHSGALSAGGLTVAVLGCGLDIAYPPEHADLMETIGKNGMVISEYPPNTPPLAHHFPARNRIISGLCDGVVVVEAPEKSGALITAEYALQQGRDVFAVPGDITRGHSRGANNLIRQGAILISSAIDILTEYQDVYINTLKAYMSSVDDHDGENAPTEAANVEPSQDDRYDGLSETAKMIVGKLSLTPIHFDQLLQMTNLTADALSGELMLLEIGGFVKTLPGKNFILNV